MTLAERYRSLPRAARWGLIAVGVIIAYFAAIEPALDRINKVRAKVGTKEAILASYERDQDKLRMAYNEIGAGLTRYGDVSFEFADRSDARATEFNKTVAAILKKHGVSQSTTTARPATLGTGPLQDAVGQGYRVERLINEYQFEAEPEVVTAVLADLERSPLVSAVSRIQVRKGDAKEGRKVRAVIAAELWSRVPKGRTR